VKTLSVLAVILSTSAMAYEYSAPKSVLKNLERSPRALLIVGQRTAYDGKQLLKLADGRDVAPNCEFNGNGAVQVGTYWGNIFSSVLYSFEKKEDCEYFSAVISNENFEVTSAKPMVILVDRDARYKVVGISDSK
jgi:hypothetical protein